MCSSFEVGLPVMLWQYVSVGQSEGLHLRSKRFGMFPPHEVVCSSHFCGVIHFHPATYVHITLGDVGHHYFRWQFIWHRLSYRRATRHLNKRPFVNNNSFLHVSSIWVGLLSQFCTSLLSKLFNLQYILTVVVSELCFCGILHHYTITSFQFHFLL